MSQPDENVRVGTDAPAATPGEPDSLATPRDIALWKPSLTTLLLAGAVDGIVLGCANGLLAYWIVAGFSSPWAASLWSGGLGLLGGVALVLVRRAVWGPDVSVEVGTLLGLLYGILPGIGVLSRDVFVGVYLLAGLVSVSSMAGFILGGILDRITESLIARQRRRAAN